MYRLLTLAAVLMVYTLGWWIGSNEAVGAYNQCLDEGERVRETLTGERTGSSRRCELMQAGHFVLSRIIRRPGGTMYAIECRPTVTSRVSSGAGDIGVRLPVVGSLQASPTPSAAAIAALRPHMMRPYGSAYQSPAQSTDVRSPNHAASHTRFHGMMASTMKRLDLLKTTGMTRRQLIRNYVVFLKARENAHFIDGLVRENPEAAWPLVVELIQRAPKNLLGDLGAGLLENLLSFHGAKFIDRVEARAKKDKRFRIALRGTWGHTRMPKSVYERKEKACADIPAY